MSCSSGSGGSTSCASIGNVKIAAGTLTNYGASTRLPIDVGGGIATVNVLRVKIDWTAGTAASFTPRLYSAIAGVAGSIDMEFQGSSTLVAALFDVACAGVVFQTDTSGQFYLEPGPNAGADNAFAYDVVYEVVG
jgi:hypothetical protein